MPFDRRTTVASPTGAGLNLYTRRANGTPRAVVQINHGLAEHAGRYAGFADFLAVHGLATYAHDHRGHGATRAPDAPLGRFAAQDGQAKVIADVMAVHDLIAKENPHVPIILFGHSMGALIALRVLQLHSEKVHAAAVWNATLSAGLAGRAAQAVLAWERFRLGSDVPSRLLPKLTFRAWGEAVEGHRTLYDWLSRDPGEVDKYIADPLCGWDPSISMWRDVFDLIFADADDANFGAVRRDLPVFLVGGDKDPSTDGGKAVRHLYERMRRMGFSRTVMKINPGARHESLNDSNRDAMMEDFVSWADEVLNPKGPAAGPPQGP